MKKTAIYPGTFDPVTYGHLDVLDRAVSLFDKVIISVSASSSKNTLFSVDERMNILRKVTGKYRSVEVDSFTGLLVEYAKRKKAQVVIRGLRAISDFEYEFQMALTNRKMEDSLTTVFLMPNEKFAYLNSTLVREIAKYHGDLSPFVPPVAAKMLRAKFLEM